MSEQRSALDFVHLEQATEGDTSLQKEVLALFMEQLPLYLEAMETCEGEELKIAAHRLKGAAQSIGATPTAEMASALEHGTFTGSKEGAIDALKIEIERLKTAVSVI